MTARVEDIIEQMPYLRMLARSKARDHALADDLVQDCLLRAIAKRDSFRTGTNLRAWLSTILTNLFINEMRRRQRWDAAVDPDNIIPHLATPASQEHRHVMHEVSVGMSLMPSDQRDALRLVGMHGFSYEEASDELGVPVGTVKSRVSRARQALRGHIDRDTYATAA